MKRRESALEKILAYSAGRHRVDLTDLLAQSADHKTLCLSFFTRFLLGIPQRGGGLDFNDGLLGKNP
jgi:hypothetical protein